MDWARPKVRAVATAEVAIALHWSCLTGRECGQRPPGILSELQDGPSLELELISRALRFYGFFRAQDAACRLVNAANTPVSE
jgi:hypothetical protein